MPAKKAEVVQMKQKASFGLRPLGGLIYVEQDVEKQKGLIILPQANKLFSGTIVAVGPGKKLDNGRIIPMEVEVGDRVVFGENIGQSLTHNGKDYLVMHQADIAGIIE
jgi:chaperonin GroES